MIRRQISALLGSLLVIVTPVAAEAQAPPSATEALQADLAEQEGRIRALEKKLAEVLARQKEPEKQGPAAPPPKPGEPPPAPPPPPEALASKGLLDRILPGVFKDLTFSAYLQAQYEAHQDAQDQLDPSGAPLNTDRFLLRRGRIKVEKEWQYASTMLELDGNTTNGPSLSVLHAEASVLYRGARPFTLPPYLKVTLGLFDTPFGYELVESPRTRWFMERSLASRSFWPGEPDLGARITSALGWFRTSVAILNGNPAGLKSGFPLRAPAASKDIAARAGAEVEPLPWLFLAGGVSVYNGKGFHPGSAPTGAGIQWIDMNGDGLIEPSELVGVPSGASLPSQTFDRWAVGGDLRAEARSPAGLTRLTFEVIVGNNMDRGLFIADPILTHIDNRELGYALGVTQELFGYGVLGFRFDAYDPSSGDRTSRQGGALLPLDQTVRTFSPLAGLTLPERLGVPAQTRLLFQYDVNRNNLGLDARGVPTNLASDTWTLRLQGAL